MFGLFGSQLTQIFLYQNFGIYPFILDMIGSLALSNKYFEQDTNFQNNKKP